MTKRKRMEDGRSVTFTFPKHIFDYFENQAREELEDEGTEINAISLGRMRNDLIMSALEAAIQMYEELGGPDYER